VLKRLDGRVAIVTGAGQGIGKAIAIALAGEGARVVVNDLVADTAASTAEEITCLGGQSLAVQADVSVSVQVDRLVSRVLDTFGNVDILVNNAGIAIPAHVTELSEESWDRTMQVNLKSMFLCSKTVAPHMMSRRYGKIVNVSSKSGKRGGLWLTAYSTSKFGVIGFTQSLAMDLAPYNVNVNAICPGTVYTPLWDRVLKHQYARKLQMDADEIRDYYTSKIPLGREINPQEIGSVVVFLCSSASNYMTGQAINITGGQEMD
jgi:sorbitol-6-phosphate 2-dehydrogenase